MKTGVAYHDVRDLHHARADLEDMIAHNCTFVVHTFSETDLSFYTRTMKDIVQASKEYTSTHGASAASSAARRFHALSPRTSTTAKYSSKESRHPPHA